MSSALWLAIWVVPVQWRRSDTAGVTLVTIRSCNTICHGPVPHWSSGESSRNAVEFGRWSANRAVSPRRPGSSRSTATTLRRALGCAGKGNATFPMAYAIFQGTGGWRSSRCVSWNGERPSRMRWSKLMTGSWARPDARRSSLLTPVSMTRRRRFPGSCALSRVWGPRCWKRRMTVLRSNTPCPRVRAGQDCETWSRRQRG